MKNIVSISRDSFARQDVDMKKINIWEIPHLETFYVWARQSNGGILYYVVDTNGIHMIPNGLSLAWPLSRKEAIFYKKELAKQYKGLEFHYSSFQSGSRK